MRVTTTAALAITLIAAHGCSGDSSNGGSEIIAIQGEKRTPIALSAPAVEDVSYSWEFEGDSLGGSISVDTDPWSATVVLPRAGTARVKRVATSDAVEVQVIRFDVTVGNREPAVTAVAVFGTTSGVHLSAAELDQDGDPLTRSWRVLDAPTGATPSFSDPSLADTVFMSDVAGTYRAEVAVDDGDGGTATSEVSFQVYEQYAADVAPPAQFSNRRYVAAQGLFLMLDAGQSAGLYDLLTNSTIATPGLDAGTELRGISPNGRYALFLKQDFDDELTIYDLQTRSVADSFILPPSEGYVFDVAIGNHGIYYIRAAGPTIGMQLFEHRWADDTTTLAKEFEEEEIYFHFFVSAPDSRVVVFSGEIDLTSYTTMSTASGPFSLVGSGTAAWTPPGNPFHSKMLADGRVMTPTGRLASLSSEPPQLVATTPIQFDSNAESFAQSGDYYATVTDTFKIYDNEFQPILSEALADWQPASVIGVDGGFVLFQENSGTVRSAFIPTP